MKIRVLILLVFVIACSACKNPNTPDVPDVPNDSIESPSGDTLLSEVTYVINDVSFKMVFVEGGTFMMGAMDKDEEAKENEKPTHSVSLNNFYIGETEVTQSLWMSVMGENPSNFPGTNKPVESISWEECKDFINTLNNLLSKDLNGMLFRLPTEAEWEFAARGGNKSKGYFYSGSNIVGEVAWYVDNSDQQTHIVKQKAPNELGLYDMSGNVWEWCSDWYDAEYYSSSPSNNPKGPSSGTYRVIRGGSWGHYDRFCRFSYRGRESAENKGIRLGFRLILSE